jgi:hypothetical protein
MSAVEFLAGSEVRGPARIYYWGSNDRDPGWTPVFRDFLVNRFQEAPNRLSEPDIIIEADSVVVFVEVKFMSPNERGKVIRDVYLSPACIGDTSGLKEAGMYELTRNWAIGLEWARTVDPKRRFVLVNLVRECEEGGIEEEFGSLILQNREQKFRRITWESLVREVCPELTERFRAVTTYCGPAFPGLGSGP